MKRASLRRLPSVPVLATALLAALLGACAQVQPPKTVVKEVRVEVPVKVTVATPGDEAARALLAYQDRIRQMQAAELAQEIQPRDDAALAPAAAVPLALALMTNHAPGDLARAQSLLDQVLRQPAAPEWKPLAQLLMDRLTEQRRLEDQADKLNQIRGDLQRRLDQANQKLEALKAIERSLGAPRPATPSSTPASPPATPPASAANGSGK